MQFDLGCHLDYTLSGPATLLFNIHAARNDAQIVTGESLFVEPFYQADFYTDLDNNQFFRVNAGSGPLSIRYQATVDVGSQTSSPQNIGEVLPSQPPLQVVPYLYPSRYCQSDRLSRLAMAQFGDVGTGHARVTAICNWIYENIEYLRGSSDEHTSAFDIVTERAGVCRDFAHLGIAFCRALQIPARFVTAYAHGLVPPDFHACFEAYLGGRWYFFDATRQAPQTGIVRIGAGRDAADVSFATLFGPISFGGMEVWMNARGAAPTYTTEAVALA